MLQSEPSYERIQSNLPSSTVFNFLEACREAGCPICRLEQQSVERYLDHQFYENVNSPKWREGLRASLGFCHEHAWLGVNQRLGDALGYSIIYRDLVNSILNQLAEDSGPARNKSASALAALTPRKRCPVCEKRDHTTHMYLSVLVEEMKSPETIQALRTSEGLCLSHLRQTLERIKDSSTSEKLLDIHREKLASLTTELEEFIRKNDYQAFKEGFGKEGDAWLRAIAMIVGNKKEK
jgi:hypothetical protein